METASAIPEGNSYLERKLCRTACNRSKACKKLPKVARKICEYKTKAISSDHYVSKWKFYIEKERRLLSKILTCDRNTQTIRATIEAWKKTSGFRCRYTPYDYYNSLRFQQKLNQNDIVFKQLFESLKLKTTYLPDLIVK